MGNVLSVFMGESGDNLPNKTNMIIREGVKKWTEWQKQKHPKIKSDDWCDDWFLRVERSVGHVPEPEDQLQSVGVGCLPPADDGGTGQVRRVPGQNRHLVHGLWNREAVVRSFAD